MILKHFPDCVPFKSVALVENLGAVPASRRSGAPAGAPLAQLPAADGGDAVVSAGAWALHVTLPLSSFLQMSGVHFVLKLCCARARAFQPWLAATARNEIQMSMTYGKSTISLEYCSQWNPTLTLTAPSCSLAPSFPCHKILHLIAFVRARLFVELIHIWKRYCGSCIQSAVPVISGSAA